MNTIEATHLHTLARDIDLTRWDATLTTVPSRYTYYMVDDVPETQELPVRPLVGEGVTPICLYRGDMWRGYYVVKSSESYPEYQEVKPEEMLAKHALLRRLGVPVCRRMWINDKGQVVMSDERRGRRCKVISRHDPVEFPGLDKFSKIISIFLKIAEQAYANGSGVYLFRDAYTLLFDTTQTDSVTGSVPIALDFGIRSYRMSVYRPFKKFSLDGAKNEAEHAARQLFSLDR